MTHATGLKFIPFTCPHCGAFTEVEPVYAGKSGPCFVCGRTIKVPYVIGAVVYDAAKGDTAKGGTDSAPVMAATATPARRQLINAILILGAACLFVGAGGAIALKLAQPAMIALKKSAARDESQRKLQRIVAGLRAYEAQYGSLPPPYTVDANGKKMHSWRVLILPFLGGDIGGPIQYNFAEPWDSQNNLRFAAQIPDVFSCSLDPASKTLGETSYVVVIGPRTAFRDQTANADEETKAKERVKLSDISDGPGNTLLVVEYHRSGIVWTEPKDLYFARMSFNVNEEMANSEMRSEHEGCVFAGRADGAAVQIGDGAPPRDVRAMLTIDGDEKLDWTLYLPESK